MEIKIKDMWPKIFENQQMRINKLIELLKQY
jgi:hypothetical protein